jgi:hypothetical protein
MNKMAEAGTASPADLELLYFTDSIDDNDGSHTDSGD